MIAASSGMLSLVPMRLVTRLLAISMRAEDISTPMSRLMMGSTMEVLPDCRTGP